MNSSMRVVGTDETSEMEEGLTTASERESEGEGGVVESEGEGVAVES